MDFGFYETPESLNFLKLSSMREGVSPVVPAPLRCALCTLLVQQLLLKRCPTVHNVAG